MQQVSEELLKLGSGDAFSLRTTGMNTICEDCSWWQCESVQGTQLLTKADSMTQKLLLIGMWEEFDLFVAKGVILGIA